ncbi:delta-aminolevulinic acid dehydratase [Aphidius gifuensis]|uniref:delta-aminolevulinic acid dehydratase n=1 Tax=Aphidius gifuensis TaxID=684658 RepID=UPI001CDBE89D|nr:delta-aminolevulinic acid dehydratase [Aphidius gifuensis]
MSSTIELKNRLHSGIFHPVLREWQSTGLEITPSNLMYPIFILDEPNSQDEIKSMPGICRYGVNKLHGMLKPLVAKGLKSILLFGIISNKLKDSIGKHADSELNPVIQALPLLRKWFPDVVIACDVCLCPYTLHGHCGIVHDDGVINNEPSIKRIAEISVSYARAGAHIIAPSDMMDGRIGAIKKSLINAGFENRVAVLSYSVKFASGFYGPFRDAANSTPQFGDRKCYQLPPGSVGLATRAATRDVDEGADILMVKPGLPYIDILRNIKQIFPQYPMFVYQVSGEYAMLYHGAKNGAVDLDVVLKEILLSMRRAGADCIITYFTPKILDMLQPKNKET